MKINLWEKAFGAKRRRLDRALLASMEREIAEAERAARAPPKLTHEERLRIARAFGRPS